MPLDHVVDLDGVVLEHYYFDNLPYQIAIGPRGSGKSVANCEKLFRNAIMQPPAPDGYRYRRSLIVRKTYDQLERTTVRTWLSRFPESDFGPFKWQKPFRHPINVEDIRWEVIFLAIEDAADYEKLLSFEASDAWINEAREVERQLFDDIDAVVGRYPPKDLGGRFNPQVLADSNAPAGSHWLSYMAGLSIPPADLTAEQRAAITRPPTWGIYIQPPALIEKNDDDGEVVGYEINPDAENVKHIGEDYYLGKVAGKSRTWIRANFLNLPSTVQSGQPVWPTFREDFHVAREPLNPFKGHQLIVGVDFGRTGAAVIGQCVFDRWFILDELYWNNVGAQDAAGMLKRRLAQKFPGLRYVIYGDPAGSHQAQTSDTTPFMEFRAAGLQAYPAPFPSSKTNDPEIRINAVRYLLNQNPGGLPTLLVDPRCTRLIAAMAGDYQFRRRKVSHEEYEPTPRKNEASHVADAAQYLVLGGGGGRAVVSSGERGSARVVRARRRRGWNKVRA